MFKCIFIIIDNETIPNNIKLRMLDFLGFIKYPLTKEIYEYAIKKNINEHIRKHLLKHTVD